MHGVAGANHLVAAHVPDGVDFLVGKVKVG
jgi:hypothetical protein